MAAAFAKAQLNGPGSSADSHADRNATLDAKFEAMKERKQLFTEDEILEFVEAGAKLSRLDKAMRRKALADSC